MIPTVRKAIEAADGSDGRMDGWASLSAVGDYIRKPDPAFEPRGLGHKSLSALIGSRPNSFRSPTERRKNGATAIHFKAIY